MPRYDASGAARKPAVWDEGGKPKKQRRIAQCSGGALLLYNSKGTSAPWVNFRADFQESKEQKARQGAAWVVSTELLFSTETESSARGRIAGQEIFEESHQRNCWKEEFEGQDEDYWGRLLPINSATCTDKVNEGWHRVSRAGRKKARGAYALAGPWGRKLPNSGKRGA